MTRASFAAAAAAAAAAPQECDALVAASDGRQQDAHVVGRGDGLTNSFGYRQVSTPAFSCALRGALLAAMRAAAPAVTARRGR